MSSTKTFQHASFGKQKSAFYRALQPYLSEKMRDLPWRRTHSPYRILVSEIMLQQTQVHRVIPKYKEFMRKFPTVRALKEASLSDVLRAWQGLGYNRRAKMLRDAAQSISTEHRNRVPNSYELLRALPGIGDYTAKAVRVFAFNEFEPLIETNIRAVIIHHFFSRAKSVSDADIYAVMSNVAHRGEPRNWYAALMDYGTDLKKTQSNPSRRSAHYAKQKPFKGSLRATRGAILKALLIKPSTRAELKTLIGETNLHSALYALTAEGIVMQRGSRYALKDS